MWRLDSRVGGVWDSGVTRLSLARAMSVRFTTSLGGLLCSTGKRLVEKQGQRTDYYFPAKTLHVGCVLFFVYI